MYGKKLIRQAVLGLILAGTAISAVPVDAAGLIQEEQGPTLAVKHSLKGNSLHLKLEVSRFTFSLDNMGKENKAGEGHAVLYLDGKKTAKIFDKEYVLDEIPPGKHQVVIELAHNNHESYGVRQTFQISVNP
ncbi:hypothetical protein [Brevibacillus massiliensis]|jgi:hypothetical protein|uniref:hypothetical protein n=1 Tax=Brevibacillus massiliensis TaxID=1118054 RepID=UPI00031DDF9C|nr:hypothetical protein [Brevibacillus massiliensis]